MYRYTDFISLFNVKGFIPCQLTLGLTVHVMDFFQKIKIILKLLFDSYDFVKSYPCTPNTFKIQISPA